MEEQLETAAVVFSALGNRVRLQILLMLTDTRKPLHIKAVARNLEMDYAAVYRHVEVLAKAGLIMIHEVGRSRVLSLTRPEQFQQLLNMLKDLT